MGSPGVLDFIRQRAVRAPEDPALLAEGRAPLCYGELVLGIERTAERLRAAGIGPQARVGLVAAPGPDALGALIALLAAAVAAPLSPQFRESELDAAFSALRIDALLTVGEGAALARRVAEQRGIPTYQLDALPAATGAPVAWPGGDDDALLLRTSGTTSTPKTVALTAASLCTAAVATARALELGSGDRCLNLLPLFHLSGIAFGTLTSLVSGGSIVVLAAPFDARASFALIESLAPTWLSATPTVLASLLARAPLERPRLGRHALRFIRSSAAALAPPLLEALETTFGVPVVEAYSLTEAPGVTSNTPRTRKPGSVGPTLGARILIADDGGMPLPLGESGNVLVQGPSVMRGYDGEPSGESGMTRDGWLVTGDVGRLDTDGFLFLTGRTKEMIKRGGEAIAPREIEDTVLDHPDVAEAAAFGVPDPRLGEEIALAVVTRPDATLRDEALRDFVAARLSPNKVPRHVVFLDELPHGPTGKVLRRALRLDPVALDTAPVRAGGPPQTPVESLVAEIWKEFFGLRELPRDANFFAYGGDSLLAARLVARLATLLDIQLALHRIFEDPTVAGVAAAVEKLLLEDEAPEVARV